MLFDLMFPNRCPMCDRVMGLGESGMCEECMPHIQYVSKERCFQCGKSLESAEEEYCYDCRNKKHLYECGRALYEYKGIEESIYRFKYLGRQCYGESFAKELAFYFGDFIRRINPDAILYVPMHPRKERRRGYNQAKVLAKALGKELGIPVLDGYVQRIRYTKPLKNLNSEERINSLKKAFILGENSVELSTVLIVDDIYTTGSTIDEITRVLQTNREIKTYFITLAIGKGI